MAHNLKKALDSFRKDSACDNVVHAIAQRVKDGEDFFAEWQGLYGESVVEVLESKLSGTFERVAILRVLNLAQQLSYCIFKAIDHEDEKMLLFVTGILADRRDLVGPVRGAYHQMYKCSVVDDLGGKFYKSPSLCHLITSILNVQVSASTEVSKREKVNLKSQVEAKNAFAFMRILTSYSQEWLEAFDCHVQSEYGKSLAGLIDDVADGFEEEILQTLLDPLTEVVASYAVNEGDKAIAMVSAMFGDDDAVSQEVTRHNKGRLTLQGLVKDELGSNSYIALYGEH